MKEQLMRYGGHRLALGLLGLTIVLGGCVTAGAQSRPTPQWRRQVNAQGADRQVLLRRVTFRVDAQGRVVREVWQRQRVLTDRGADVHCDPRVTWDAGRQTLRVLRAQTRMVSGRVVKTPASGVNRVTPRAFALAPAYARFTDTVVSLLGIEPGAVTDHGYRLTDRAPPALPFGARVAVGDVGPVQRLEVVVEVAAGQKLRHACLGCPPSRLTVKRAGGRTRYTWTFRNLRPTNLYERRSGRRRPPSTDPLPQLVFTTAPSWDAALAPLRRRLAAGARVSPSVAALAKKLGKSAQTSEQKLTAALRFVTRAVRAVRFDGLRHGLLPAPAATVLRRGYGHALDQGALLLALLRAMSVGARPILVQRGPRLAPNVPTTAQLGTLWIEVKLGSATLWVDPRSGRIRPQGAGLAGRYRVSLAGAARLVRIRPGPGAGAKLAVSGVVDGRGRVCWQAAVSLNGAANPFARAAAWAPKASKRKRKGLARSLLSGAGKASRTTTARPGLLRTRFTARLESKLSRGAARLESLRLPDACRFLDRVRPLRDKPQLDLLLPAGRLSCKLALSLTYAADAFEPVIRPRSLTVKSAVGEYKRVVQMGRGRLNVVVKLTVNGPRVAPGRVADLRRLLAAARAEEAHLVVFRRLKKAPPPQPSPQGRPPAPRPAKR
jgi:hypothetical protein